MQRKEDRPFAPSLIAGFRTQNTKGIAMFLTRRTAMIGVAGLAAAAATAARPEAAAAATEVGTLTSEEKKIVIDDDGTTMQAMTYNGSIPGPLMVVHQDDYIELTLVNPAANQMAHNIDFHAATGALGGAPLTLINPGEQVVLRFKATRPGRSE